MYCICNGPEKRPMVGCDSCNQWFHFTCMGLKKDSVLPDQWFCLQCRKRNDNGELKSYFDGLKNALVETMKEGFLHLKQNQQQATKDTPNAESELVIKQLQDALQQQKIEFEKTVESLGSQLQVQYECNIASQKGKAESELLVRQLQEALQQQKIEYEKTVEGLQSQLQVQCEGNRTERLQKEFQQLKERLNQQEMENAKLIKEKEELQQKVNLERKRKRLSTSQNM